MVTGNDFPVCHLAIGNDFPEKNVGELLEVVATAAQVWKKYPSRISNAVTHLRSYTNTAIARNSAPGAGIAAPSVDIIA